MNEPKSEISRWVVNTSKDTFQVDVFEQSRESLVIVDFWAPWCAPCRALGPVLEKLARQFDGRIVLVKANTDESPELAAGFDVQGIPAVFAISDGEVVDSFTGALPESQLRAWLEALLGARDLNEAKQAETVDAARAESIYRGLLEENANHAEARIGLARTLLEQGRPEESRREIAELEKRGFLEPEAQRLRSVLELRQKSGEDLAERRAAAMAEPDNLELQLLLAESLVGAQQFEESLDICLSLVEKDRKGFGERARQLMIDIFRVLPEDSELTSVYRRRLSMALF